MWIARAVFGVADFKLLGDFLDRAAPVGAKRLNVADERLAVVLEPFAGPRQQLLQVDARFGIETGEEFVEVDVRRGLGLAGASSPLCSRPADGLPGLTSTVMSCRLVFGRISSVAFL